jgi:hypothetical protein
MFKITHFILPFYSFKPVPKLNSPELKSKISRSPNGVNKTSNVAAAVVKRWPVTTRIKENAQLTGS